MIQTSKTLSVLNMTKNINYEMLSGQAIKALIVAYQDPAWKFKRLKGFAKFAFPIIRRVFPSLIANEIVSVQPMSLPTGLLSHLDYAYGSIVSSSIDKNGG